ncbi:hypothetical protein TNCV_3257561 [Trichonephila clavipes]|nr:hypothetical protein TNCV_3257561 [Trichonephila clavipes]
MLSGVHGRRLDCYCHGDLKRGEVVSGSGFRKLKANETSSDSEIDYSDICDDCGNKSFCAINSDTANSGKGTDSWISVGSAVYLLEVAGNRRVSVDKDEAEEFKLLSGVV